jgi:predicted AAA+ superfamily ATPase
LRRITSDVFYFKTENGKEIDFLIKQPKKGIILIQVCESMADPQTRKRELAALEKGMQQLRVTEGWIITRRDSEEISTEEGKIFIVPLWQFAWEYKTLFSRNGIS